jgi:hypothetical protein
MNLSQEPPWSPTQIASAGPTARSLTSPGLNPMEGHRHSHYHLFALLPFVSNSDYSLAAKVSLAPVTYKGPGIFNSSRSPPNISHLPSLLCLLKDFLPPHSLLDQVLFIFQNSKTQVSPLPPPPTRATICSILLMELGTGPIPALDVWKVIVCLLRGSSERTDLTNFCMSRF